jgi:hypothetical protein
MRSRKISRVRRFQREDDANPAHASITAGGSGSALVTPRPLSPSYSPCPSIHEINSFAAEFDPEGGLTETFADSPE